MKKKLDIDRIIEIIAAFEVEKSNDLLDGKVMFGLSKFVAKLRPLHRAFLQAREPMRLSILNQLLVAKTPTENEKLNSQYQVKENELKETVNAQSDKTIELFDFKESDFIASEDFTRKRFVGEGATMRMEEIKISKGTILVSGEFLAAMGDLIK